jgi:hypothetical protein
MSSDDFDAVALNGVWPMGVTIFKVYDIRGIYPDQINEEHAWKIGYAAGRVRAVRSWSDYLCRCRLFRHIELICGAV